MQVVVSICFSLLAGLLSPFRIGCEDFSKGEWLTCVSFFLLA